MDIYDAAGMPKPTLTDLNPDFIARTQQADNPHLALGALRKLLNEEPQTARDSCGRQCTLPRGLGRGREQRRPVVRWTWCRARSRPAADAEEPRMPVLLILLVVAIVEVAVLVAVGDAIGVLPTIGLLILASVVGAWLLRREGTRALGAFSEAVRTRRPPHRELVDGVLIAAAGVLIVLPGFVSDVLALLLLLPPTRSLVRGRMLRSASRRAPVQHRPGGVVEGEVVDDHRPASGELR